jgi:hypothetical protein
LQPKFGDKGEGTSRSATHDMGIISSDGVPLGLSPSPKGKGKAFDMLSPAKKKSEIPTPSHVFVFYWDLS